MLELAKIIGALVWIVGLVLLFVLWPVGVLVLVLAVIISIYTATKTREKRHKEIVQAASQGRPAPSKRAPSTSERLEELNRLREQGAISDDEYMSMRRDILDQL